MTVRIRLARVSLGVRTMDLEVRSPAVPVKEFANCVCEALGLHTGTEVAARLSEAPNLLRQDETLAGVWRRTGIMDMEIAVLEAGGAVDEEDATSIESRARLDMLMSQVGEVEREMKRLIMIFTVANSTKQTAKASIAQHDEEDIEGLRRRLEESEERVLQLEEQLHQKVIPFIQTAKVMRAGKPFDFCPRFLGLNPAAAGVR
jgi:hypothetical protein